MLADGAAEGGIEGLHFADLQITHVDGNIVIADANTEIAKGERVLIVGPSGSGKSTLFRAIAGLWPWGAGKIVMPDRSRMMFMPQRPYLPLGTLRAAVVLSGLGAQVSLSDVKAALASAAGSSIWSSGSTSKERWDKVLSGGEQQRVAFARLLLHKPEWVFMDEATSALDEEGQASLMGLFTKELAGTTRGVDRPPSGHGRVPRPHLDPGRRGRRRASRDEAPAAAGTQARRSAAAATSRAWCCGVSARRADMAGRVCRPTRSPR